mgnify:CR=1 FL=1
MNLQIKTLLPLIVDNNSLVYPEATQIFVLSQKLVSFYLNMMKQSGQMMKIIMATFQI